MYKKIWFARLTGFILDGTDRDPERRDVDIGIVGVISEIPVGTTSRLLATFTLENCSVRGPKSKAGAKRKTEKKTFNVSVSAHVDDVEIATAEDIAASAASSVEPPTKAARKDGDEAVGVFKKYPFLKSEENKNSPPEIAEDWEKHHVLYQPLADCSDIKAKAALAMIAMKQAKQLTSEDILITHRQGRKIEVWTLVPFKAGKLVLTPYTTEIKDRYWTMGRSTSLKSTSVPKGKNLAIDGRLYSKVPQGTGDKAGEAEQKASFSLYWAIERTQSKAEANLSLEYASVKIAMQVEMAHGQTPKGDNKDDALHVPYLVNAKEVPAKTRLVTFDDRQLQRIAASSTKEYAIV